MEVPLDAADENARLITKRVHRVPDPSTQERLARIDQIEANICPLALLENALNETILVFCVARTQRDHIESGLAQRCGPQSLRTCRRWSKSVGFRCLVKEAALMVLM